MLQKFCVLSLLTSALIAAPPAASVRVNVEVPASMRQGVFATNRTLLVPPGFRVSVVARVPGARFMAEAPNGDIFVSQPGTGKITIIRLRVGADPLTFEYASGLRNPHDIVFHSIAGIMHVYIAESHQINRYIYYFGDTVARQRQIVVANLPDASTPELNGPHAHALKNIALDGEKLYVSSASTCNACISDLTSIPMRAAIYQYSLDGSNQRLFASGVRNAEGLAILPGTNQLWVVVNGRDEIRLNGQLVRSYVDNHPPEIFTLVRDGGNYGWPFCHPTQDSPSGYENMLLENDSEVDPNNTINCSAMDRPTRGIQAHSAPLGLSFLHNSNLPAAYRIGAVAALHGSWNRSNPTGYKVIYFPWNNAKQAPDAPIDLVSGWLSGQTVWGRPVDAIPDAGGGLLISDDSSGTIYRLAPTASNQDGCNFTMPAAGAGARADGETASVSLMATNPSCAWTASTATSWLQVYPLSGTGSAELQYTVFPNYSATPRTATILAGGRAFTITQAASLGTPNQLFVAQMYFNFLGRRAAPEEIAVHAAALAAGLSRAALAFNFMNTPEFNLGGRFIAGLYAGVLARDAEYGGWLFQRNAMLSGAVDPIALTGNFVNSAEFVAKFGTVQDTQFVTLLYRNILLREPTINEVMLQVNALRVVSRAALAYSFLNTPEFRAGAGPRLTAFLLYATLLQRGPSPSELATTMQQISAGANIQALIAGLL